MQSLRSSFISIGLNFLSTTSKLPTVNVERSYVKAFWAQNNEYKGLKGHTRNPPKMGGYTLNSTRKVSLIRYFNFPQIELPTFVCTEEPLT